MPTLSIRKTIPAFLSALGLKEKTNGKGKFFVIQFAYLKENTPEEKEVFRAMYFQFAGHTIDQTGDAEKKMKDDSPRRSVCVSKPYKGADSTTLPSFFIGNFAGRAGPQG